MSSKFKVQNGEARSLSLISRRQVGDNKMGLYCHIHVYSYLTTSDIKNTRTVLAIRSYLIQNRKGKIDREGKRKKAIFYDMTVSLRT